MWWTIYYTQNLLQFLHFLSHKRSAHFSFNSRPIVCVCVWAIFVKSEIIAWVPVYSTLAQHSIAQWTTAVLCWVDGDFHTWCIMNFDQEEKKNQLFGINPFIYHCVLGEMQQKTYYTDNKVTLQNLFHYYHTRANVLFLSDTLWKCSTVSIFEWLYRLNISSSFTSSSFFFCCLFDEFMYANRKWTKNIWS